MSSIVYIKNAWYFVVLHHLWDRQSCLKGVNVSFYSFCSMQGHFLTCTMKFSENNDIEFMITKWNEKAMKKRITDGTGNELEASSMQKLS